MASDSPSPHSPHDKRFKNLFSSDLRGFVSLFMPDMAKVVKWGAITFIDKELFIDIPAGARREIDLLARLPTRQGDLAFLLLTEIEDREGRTRDEMILPERIFMYYGLARSRYRLPIFPVMLYLFHARSGQPWHLHRHGLLDHDIMTLKIRRIALPTLDARTYLSQGTAMAGALGALMDRGRWSPAEHKVACLDVIGKANANDAVKFLALDTVETYLELSEAEAEKFEALLGEEEHVEARNIEKTWAERLKEKAWEEGLDEGIEEGRKEGRREGRREGRKEGLLRGRQDILLKLLRLKFGPPSPSLEARVKGIRDIEKLDAIAEKILSAKDLRALGLGEDS